ncbi:MAG TPA: hypothetical protein VF573_00255, partial [Paraburkholderia sp.]
MTFARLPRLSRALARGARYAGAIAGAFALAACSSPSSRFYTLGADGVPAGSAAPVSARTSAAPAWLIEVA